MVIRPSRILHVIEGTIDNAASATSLMGKSVTRGHQDHRIQSTLVETYT
jgi:hypothetical protein